MEETGFCVGRVEGSVVASRWSAAVVSGRVRRNIRGLQGKRRFRMSDLGSFESKRNKGTEIEGPVFAQCAKEILGGSRLSSIAADTPPASCGGFVLGFLIVLRSTSTCKRTGFHSLLLSISTTVQKQFDYVAPYFSSQLK